jgi:hypothetical protein
MPLEEFSAWRASIAGGDHPDVLECKLAGKARFVHRSLWPALLRVVTDEDWRAARLANLSRSLATAVRGVSKGKRLGTVDRRGKAILEKSCLLHVSSEHTKTRTHETVWRSWESWAPALR